MKVISMISLSSRTIFKNSSTTYFYASLFFPRYIRKDIFTFYAFVRTADDYVDSIPQDLPAFEKFCQQTAQAFQGKAVSNGIISAFYELAQKHDIAYTYVDSFLQTMRTDTKKTTYKTYKELEEYMHGSAEVIGLMMCKILHLPKKAYPYAQLQGKAMQLINFIRDIQEDSALGRVYIPEVDMNKFNVKKFSPVKESAAFKKLIVFELEKYYQLQQEAAQGYDFIPPHLLLPIKTAASIYNWTAREIEKDPLVVLNRKVKPNLLQIGIQLFRTYFTL